jgi:hypothetical protein
LGGHGRNRAAAGQKVVLLTHCPDGRTARITVLLCPARTLDAFEGIQRIAHRVFPHVSGSTVLIDSAIGVHGVPASGWNA